MAVDSSNTATALQRTEGWDKGSKRSKRRRPSPDRRPSAAPLISHRSPQTSQPPPAPISDDDREMVLCLMMLSHAIRDEPGPHPREKALTLNPRPQEKTSTPDSCPQETASTSDSRPQENNSISNPRHEQKVATPIASNPVASSSEEGGDQSEDENHGLVPVPLRVLLQSMDLKLEQNDGLPMLLPPGPLPPLLPPLPSKEASYKCQCGKTFASYQALGGHKTSHRDWRKPVPATNNAPNGHDGQTTSASASAVPGAAPARILGDGKIHRCKLCRREFPTGQALGGHMRLHYNPSAASSASAAAPKGEGSEVTTASCDAAAPSSGKKRGLDLYLNRPVTPPPEAMLDGEKEEGDREVMSPLPLTKKPRFPPRFFNFLEIPEADSLLST